MIKTHKKTLKNPLKWEFIAVFYILHKQKQICSAVS